MNGLDPAPLDTVIAPAGDDIPDPDPAISLAGELLVDALDLAALKLPPEVARAQPAAVADADLVDRVMLACAQIEAAFERENGGANDGTV
jgi:hypothetical protein